MDYWRECVSGAFDEAGIVATEEQVLAVAEVVEGAHECYGMAHYTPGGPGGTSEVDRLRAELARERSKVICVRCGGSGREVYRGPSFITTSECLSCCGAGWRAP